MSAKTVGPLFPVRSHLKERGSEAVIPLTADEEPDHNVDCSAYWERNVVERTIN